ncbi:hypothetical protein BJX66DRAFT_335988 [Aspergillus keveii]|uniref:IBR domain-containing protein n=1 Tax=Aspergillus keveii TaxID=714993 RepID=A0ABR4GBT2_9EURO
MAMHGPLQFPGLPRANEAAFAKLESRISESQAPLLDSSSPSLESVQETGEDLIRCVICHEQKLPSEMTELSCRHRHCIACVCTLAESYINGQITYPNFCCKKFEPAKSIVPCLSAAQKQAYIDKVEERHLPSHKLWYCPEPSCARWIMPREMLVKGTAFSRSFACPHCNAKICTRCRGRGHSGSCPTDEGREALLRLANAEGWQQCGRCGNLVDVDDEAAAKGDSRSSCKHAVCPCREQICYGGWFHHHGGCLMNNTWTRLKGSAIPRVMGIFRNV